MKARSIHGDDEIVPFRLKHGAWWLLPDMSSYHVGGFHEAWIREHQALVPGCADVQDVVRTRGWLAVGVYAEGSVEFIVPTLADPVVRLEVRHALLECGGSWDHAIVMPLDDEGVVRVTAETIEDFAKGA